jgi:hypothetical protein
VSSLARSPEPARAIGSPATTLVIDPLDGSANAAAGVSLSCFTGAIAVDGQARQALAVWLETGRRWADRRDEAVPWRTSGRTEFDGAAISLLRPHARNRDAGGGSPNGPIGFGSCRARRWSRSWRPRAPPTPSPMPPATPTAWSTWLPPWCWWPLPAAPWSTARGRALEIRPTSPGATAAWWLPLRVGTFGDREWEFQRSSSPSPTERSTVSTVVIYSASRWASALYASAPVGLHPDPTSANGFAVTIDDSRIEVLPPHRDDPDRYGPVLDRLTAGDERLWSPPPTPAPTSPSSSAC